MPNRWNAPPAPAQPAPAFDRASIRLLVERFYAQILLDPELGPIFDRAVEAGEGWPAHLDKLTAFWSSVLLHEAGYKGNPRMAHQQVSEIRPHHFDRWLALFRREVRAVYQAEPADALIAAAERMAVHLQRPAWG